jgi:CheY-like chemotaxis protein
VVEDEAVLREVLAVTLRDNGLRVLAVPNGTEAIAALEQSRFDLVITDLLMAGAGGQEVLAVANTLSPPVPVVVVTGRVEESDEGRLLAAGARALLRKPFPAAQIIAVAGEVLNQGDLG